MASSINASTSGAGGVITTADNSGILNLQSGGTTVATVSSTGFSTPANQTINTANTFGFKNRIINGGMVIDQRNAGAAVTYNGVEAVYNIDRWQAGAIGGGVFTVQQSSTAPAGFTTSQKYTVTTADTSIASTDRYSMYQYIEGYNVSDLGFGTANAKTFTISFWIQSSVTGQYGVAVYNAGFDRSIVNTVTINSANTWEYKSVTFTADTSGTWNTTNGVGLRMAIVFAMGSSYQGTANTWTAGFIGTTSSQVNWMATNGNTLYITGVQLEVGSQATSFDFRSATQELALCQRYYEKSYSQGTVPASSTGVGGCWFPYGGVNCFCTFPFAVEKRADATMLIWDAAGNLNKVSWVDGAAGITNNVSQGVPVQYAGTRNVVLRLSNGISGTPVAIGYQWTASAEL